MPHIVNKFRICEFSCNCYYIDVHGNPNEKATGKVARGRKPKPPEEAVNNDAKANVTDMRYSYYPSQINLDMGR